MGRTSHRMPIGPPISNYFKGAFRCATLWVFVLNVVLVSPVFTPHLKDIGLFDEAGYINSGREFVESHHLPAYGNMPLVTGFYALSYLPVRSSPFWLIHSCAIGRFALFSMLWLGAYLVSRRLAFLAPPLVLVSLLVLSPALPLLVTVGSHALFAAIATFALWQALSAYRTSDIRRLWLASIFVGLAGLCRSAEGLALVVAFVVISLFAQVGAHRLKVLIACVVPFVVVVGGYISVSAVSFGGLDLGTSEYAYNAFEQGQGLAYQDKYGNRNYYVEGQIEARHLFGTPQENHFSIVTAILKNPRAYLRRVVRLLGVAAVYAIHVYGGPLGLILLLLAARGIIELARRRLYLLLFALILWESYLLLYLLLVFQQTHFLMPFASVFSLASLGLVVAAATPQGNSERYIWATTLFLIAIASLMMRVPGYSAAVVFLVGLWIAWGFPRHCETASYSKPLKVITVLLVLSLLKGAYPEPTFRKLGVADDEQAVLFMEQHLSRAARVASYQPGNVWITKRDYVPMHRTRMPEVASNEELVGWITANHLEAIYSDTALRENEPQLWSLIETQIGRSLELGFISSHGDVQVILVKPQPHAL